jgi:hypothetical protein
MLKRLLAYFGMCFDPGAPVHVGVNPIYFTYVYEARGGYIFAWHDAQHRLGFTSTPYFTQSGAELARENWEVKRRFHEKASFIREQEL